MALNISKEARLAMLTTRLHVLKGRGDKNVKCPGVVRKLNRQIMKLEQELGV